MKTGEHVICHVGSHSGSDNHRLCNSGYGQFMACLGTPDVAFMIYGMIVSATFISSIVVRKLKEKRLKAEN